QLTSEPGPSFGEADALEELVGLCEIVLARDSVGAAHEGHVLLDGQVDVEAGRGRDVADGSLFGSLRTPCRQADQSDERPQQCRLAGAVTADDNRDRTGSGLEGHIV